MEIERKFVVPRSTIAAYPLIDTLILEQFYTSISPEIRYRKQNTSFWIAEKSDGGMIRDIPIEKEIKEKQYTKAKEHIQGQVIQKVRVRLKYSDMLTIELDLYLRPYTDLVIAEIEFKTDYDASAFVPPADWVEITMDKRYKNKTIAMNGFPDISNQSTYHP